MTDVRTDINHAMTTGPQDPAHQGVTAGEARSIIAQARSQGVAEGEIYSSFASLGLGTLYQDVQARSAGRVHGDRIVDNADQRSSEGLTDLRIAISGHRSQQSDVDTAVAALENLNRASVSNNPSWTTVNVGDDSRASQILNRADEGARLARSLEGQASLMPAGPQRDAKYAQAGQLRAAVGHLLENRFVVAHPGGGNQEKIDQIRDRLAPQS